MKIRTKDTDARRESSALCSELERKIIAPIKYTHTTEFKGCKFTFDGFGNYQLAGLLRKVLGGGVRESRICNPIPDLKRELSQPTVD